MVASGVASKGLDFNEIQHVIIFTMPKEIEDYVHQVSGIPLLYHPGKSRTLRFCGCVVALCAPCVDAPVSYRRLTPCYTYHPLIRCGCIRCDGYGRLQPSDRPAVQQIWRLALNGISGYSESASPSLTGNIRAIVDSNRTTAPASRTLLPLLRTFTTFI